MLLAGATVVLAQPKRQVLIIEYGDLANVRLSYDPSKISKAALTSLLRISPYQGDELVPPPLELCVSADPEYRECGAHNIESETFFFNAEVNLKRGQKMLDFLDQLKVPTTLKPASAFYRRRTSFWLCLERARLTYYRGDGRALQTTCDTVEAADACPTAVEQSPVIEAPARGQFARCAGLWCHRRERVLHRFALK